MEGTFLPLIFSVSEEMYCCCRVEKLYLVIIALQIAVPVFCICIDGSVPA